MVLLKRVLSVLSVLSVLLRPFCYYELAAGFSGTG